MKSSTIKLSILLVIIFILVKLTFAGYVLYEIKQYKNWKNHIDYKEFIWDNKFVTCSNNWTRQLELDLFLIEKIKELKN